MIDDEYFLDIHCCQMVAPFKIFFLIEKPFISIFKILDYSRIHELYYYSLWHSVFKNEKSDTTFIKIYSVLKSLTGNKILS